MIKEFQEPFGSEQKQNLEQNKNESSEEKEKNIYEGVLKNIFNKLNETNLDWRLVGGTALSFCLNKIPNPRRCDNSIRDLDIIILDNQPEAVEETKKFFEFFRKEMEGFNKTHPNAPVYPEVNFSQVKTKEYLKESDKSFFQLMPHILRDDSRFFLQFRDVLEEVDSRVFDPYFLKVNTEKGALCAPSFSPETLVHLYLTRIGFIKPKDLDKLKKFLRKIKQTNIPETKDHQLYLPYHRLAKRIRKRYKVMSKLWQLYTFIDYKLFNSALTHKLIPEKIIEKIVDL